MRSQELRKARLVELDHIDPSGGPELGIACERCGFVHTKAEDEAVKARWRKAQSGSAVSDE